MKHEVVFTSYSHGRPKKVPLARLLTSALIYELRLGFSSAGAAMSIWVTMLPNHFPAFPTGR